MLTDIPKDFKNEALLQMKDLPLTKKEKTIIAKEMFNDLKVFMSESEVLNVWLSKKIKWAQNAQRLLDQYEQFDRR